MAMVDPDDLKHPNRTHMQLRSGPSSIFGIAQHNQEGIPEHAENGAVCYKGGRVVNEVHEMCDVTSESLLLQHLP